MSSLVNFKACVKGWGCMSKTSLLAKTVRNSCWFYLAASLEDRNDVGLQNIMVLHQASLVLSWGTFAHSQQTTWESSRCWTMEPQKIYGRPCVGLFIGIDLVRTGLGSWSKHLCVCDNWIFYLDLIRILPRRCWRSGTSGKSYTAGAKKTYQLLSNFYLRQIVH